MIQLSYLSVHLLPVIANISKPLTAVLVKTCYTPTYVFSEIHIIINMPLSYLDGAYGAQNKTRFPLPYILRGERSLPAAVLESSRAERLRILRCAEVCISLTMSACRGSQRQREDVAGVASTLGQQNRSLYSTAKRPSLAVLLLYVYFLLLKTQQIATMLLEMYGNCGAQGTTLGPWWLLPGRCTKDVCTYDYLARLRMLTLLVKQIKDEVYLLVDVLLSHKHRT